MPPRVVPLQLTTRSHIDALQSSLREKYSAGQPFIDMYLFPTGMATPVMVQVPILRRSPLEYPHADVDYLPWLTGDLDQKVNHTFLAVDITTSGVRTPLTVFYIDQAKPFGDAKVHVPGNICISELSHTGIWKGNILVGRRDGPHTLESIVATDMEVAKEAVICVVTDPSANPAIVILDNSTSA